MRKSRLAAVGLVIVVAAGALALETNSAGVWRMEGGPLRLMGADPASHGLTIPA